MLHNFLVTVSNHKVETESDGEDTSYPDNYVFDEENENDTSARDDAEEIFNMRQKKTQITSMSGSLNFFKVPKDSGRKRFCWKSWKTVPTGIQCSINHAQEDDNCNGNTCNYKGITEEKLCYQWHKQVQDYLIDNNLYSEEFELNDDTIELGEFCSKDIDEYTETSDDEDDEDFVLENTEDEYDSELDIDNVDVGDDD
ncbi:hypothetical protein AKO1_005961 [Acrasis kona]|uniref:Uncharacterized protein n=1 Tax=Acrasis kona TaxID=1008807 RepID=A0AAW2ZJ02_9EUKA